MRGRRGIARVAVIVRSFDQWEPVRAYIEALVHPSARTDALTAARHRAFIAARLLGGAVVLAAIPLYLALGGVPSPLEAAVLVWFVSPILVVAYLSRSGDLERAHLLSAGLFAGLAVMVAGATGGVASFAAPWLALVPVEAALSASRRVILAAVAIALGPLLGLAAFGALGLLPASTVPASAYLLGTLAAATYAGALALGIGALAQGSERAKEIGEARYRLLAQNMTDTLTRHGRHGAVTFVSPAAERLVGVPAASLLGHGLFDHVHVADRPGFLSALDRAARGDDVSFEYRLRRGPLPSATGRPQEPVFVWVETRCRKLDASGQQPESGEVVAVTRDISRSKRDAEALESARSEAERASEAKSRFLATVSHELRTPLNAIIGFSELLANETAHRLDAERRMDYARVIRDSGQHLLAVVNGILDVSRIESGHFELKPESFAVAPLVEACYEMMLLRAEQAGVRLDLDVAPDLPEIVADKLALRQVLINLISNAVKFTPAGGAVAVVVRAQGAEQVFTVADTGIGIAAEHLAQVGDPFFQAATSYDRPYEGTGLGLSVVKGLVELHGGRFEIASELGKGTRVTLCLPRECRALPQAPKGRVVERLAPRAPAGAGERNQESERIKRSA